MSLHNTVDHEKEIPEVFEALGRVHYMISGPELDAKLVHLVLLRASQLNQCGHCVKMHTEDARAEGESQDRLDRLVVWRHAHDFSEQEKAALAYAEALTCMADNTDYATLREELVNHFSTQSICLLTGHIAMINLWNRFRVSQH